jgi:hypothetical protein
MSLDDDLKSLFDTNWRTGNIAKPTFKTGDKLTKKAFGDFHIQTNRLPGDPSPAALDRLFIQKEEYFILTSYRSSEANLVLDETEIYHALANPLNTNTLYEIYGDEPVNHNNKLYWKIWRGRRRQWVQIS